MKIGNLVYRFDLDSYPGDTVGAAQSFHTLTS